MYFAWYAANSFVSSFCFSFPFSSSSSLPFLNSFCWVWCFSCFVASLLLAIFLLLILFTTVTPLLLLLLLFYKLLWTFTLLLSSSLTWVLFTLRWPVYRAMSSSHWVCSKDNSRSVLDSNNSSFTYLLKLTCARVSSCVWRSWVVLRCVSEFTLNITCSISYLLSRVTYYDSFATILLRRVCQEVIIPSSWWCIVCTRTYSFIINRSSCRCRTYTTFDCSEAGRNRWWRSILLVISSTITVT